MLLVIAEPSTPPVDPCAVLDAHLARLGPTSTLLWIQLRRHLETGPHSQSTTVWVADLAAWLGVNVAVVERSLARLVRFRYVRATSPGTLVVLGAP